MRKPVSSALSFLLVAVSIGMYAEPQQQDPLVGRWRSTEVSSAGVSAVFSFGKDGVVDVYSAVILEGTYKLVGTDTIVLQSADGRLEKQELEWDSRSKARIEDEAAGKSIEMSRAATRIDAAHPLLGEWDSVLEWKGKTYPARGLFFADGRNIWMINLTVETGRYAIGNGKIRLLIPNRPTVEGDLTVADDRLMLPNPRGGQSRFNRVDSDYFPPQRSK
jgi:hypothetical protein